MENLIKYWELSLTSGFILFILVMWIGKYLYNAYRINKAEKQINDLKKVTNKNSVVRYFDAWLKNEKKQNKL